MTHEYTPQNPAIIDAEIAAGIERAGYVSVFINNFTDNLSGGRYRSLIERLGWMDRAVADPESDQDSHSTKGREVRWAQFFEDVDRAVIESGVDATELARLQELTRPSPEREGWQTREAYSLCALPVYRELRVLGYSHFELRR